MIEPRKPTPVEIAESPWEDPIDGLLSGAYRRRTPDASPEDPDHLVIYIRGSGGDPASEYRGQAAICGRLVDLLTTPTRMTEASCQWCLDGLPKAFRDAREALASERPPGELG